MNEIKMGGAIEHWLGFQDKIGRSFMMKEDAIKYPLSDYLVNDGGIHIKAIKLERPHPNFSNRRMDVAVIDRNIPNKPIVNAFELKIAKKVTRNDKERKRIFYDLIRMHLVKQCSTGKCYFIITGKTANFKFDFRNWKDNGVKFYEKWFSFVKDGKTTFNVSTETDGKYKQIYDSFVNIYGSKFQGTGTFQLPNQITTSCEFITISNKNYVSYMTGVWSVQ